MPRPIKAGIDYFPLDTDMEQDDKIALIEAKHGILGFGIIIKLFKKIYGGYGYYYDWNEEKQLLFSKQVGADFNKVCEIVDDAIRWSLFDKRLFKKYKILTSKRVQRTYLEATSRRKEIEIIKEYMLNGVNVYNNKDNVIINSINTSKSTQSKVKESKVKESKESIDNECINILDFFNQKFKSKYRLTDKLKAHLGQRLKSYSVGELKTAINIMAEIPFYKGKNDRSWKASPQYIFRNDDNVDKFLNESIVKKRLEEADKRKKEWKRKKEKTEKDLTPGQKKQQRIIYLKTMIKAESPKSEEYRKELRELENE